MSMNIETLKKIGGKEWAKSGYHRVYFNDLKVLYGLGTSQYKTGNISGASLDGEKISNSEARRICGALAECKIWFDVSDQKFHGTGIGYRGVEFSSIFQAVVKEIKARVEHAEKPKTKSEIFRAAHAVAKAGTEGKYRERFAAALKSIYASKKK